MSEPTIDEMLAWLLWVEQGTVSNPLIPFTEDEIVVAIRAILVEHRPMERGKGLLLMHPNDIDRGKLEAIRAFVERVSVKYVEDKQYSESNVSEYLNLMLDELAAMENESVA